MILAAFVVVHGDGGCRTCPLPPLVYNLIFFFIGSSSCSALLRPQGVKEDEQKNVDKGKQMMKKKTRTVDATLRFSRLILPTLYSAFYRFFIIITR